MHRSVSSKLLLSILVVGMTVAVFFAAISIYVDFSNRKAALNKRVRILKMSSVNSLTEAMFNFDDDQVRAILEGIAYLPDIVVAKVVAPDGTDYLTVKHDGWDSVISGSDAGDTALELQAKQWVASQLPDYMDSKSVPLVKDEFGRRIPLGTLQIKITYRYIYAKIILSALMQVLGQFLEMVFISILLFAMFRQLVTRHIGSMVAFFESIDWSKGDACQAEPLKLKRASSESTDEFDVLVDRINEMHGLARKALAEKTKEVEHYSNEVKTQQAAAINNARLSSLGQMAGGIAHEINNPLTIIQGHCNLLKKNIAKGDASEEQLDKSFGRISSSITRITEVTGGLLAFSRDLEDKAVVDTTVKQLMAKMDNIASLVFAQDHIHYSSYWTGPDRVIKSCEGQIMQIISSLLSNARDAVLDMPENKRWVKLDVADSHDGQMVEITVKDSGKGVLPENQQSIFEPFFTTKPIGSGAGLGLSISHGLAEELGGRIYLNHKETQTSFTVCLPYTCPQSIAARSTDDTGGSDDEGTDLPLAS